MEWVWPTVVWTLDSDAASLLCLYCLLLFVCYATILVTVVNAAVLFIRFDLLLKCCVPSILQDESLTHGEYEVGPTCTCKELSSKDTNGPKTYEECSDNVDEIVKQHLLYMSSNNIKIPEVMTQLPAFYWLPKMHKTPTGSRFIAASSSCTKNPYHSY